MAGIDFDAKYDRIGSGYNNTRKPDSYLVNRMLYHLNPSKEGIYLDVGCGTGNYTHEFQKRGYSFIGIDPSQKMLNEAVKGDSSADFALGSAEKIDFPKEHFSGAIASLTIHHWKNLQKGFSEIYQVLKPSSKVVVFTSTPRQMEGYWLNHYFPKMLEDSMVQMPSLEKVLEVLNDTGFTDIQTEKYCIQPDLEDKFLYCGKENPKVYFDEQIRKGISSFSDLSNQEEVNKGLRQLQEDIQSGYIETVMKLYDNDLGDYLYIIAEN